MARRTSALKVKQHAATMRENKVLHRERRDDGVPRRSDRELVLVDDIRALSRKPGRFRWTDSERYLQEKAYRRYLKPEVAALRATLIRLSAR